MADLGEPSTPPPAPVTRESSIPASAASAVSTDSTPAPGAGEDNLFAPSASEDGTPAPATGAENESVPTLSGESTPDSDTSGGYYHPPPPPFDHFALEEWITPETLGNLRFQAAPPPSDLPSPLVTPPAPATGLEDPSTDDILRPFAECVREHWRLFHSEPDRTRLRGEMTASWENDDTIIGHFGVGVPLRDPSTGSGYAADLYHLGAHEPDGENGFGIPVYVPVPTLQPPSPLIFLKPQLRTNNSIRDPLAGQPARGRTYLNDRMDRDLVVRRYSNIHTGQQGCFIINRQLRRLRVNGEPLPRGTITGPLPDFAWIQIEDIPIFWWLTEHDMHAFEYRSPEQIAVSRAIILEREREK